MRAYLGTTDRGKLARQLPKADASPVPHDLHAPPRLTVVLDPMEGYYRIDTTVRTYCCFAVCIVDPTSHAIGCNLPQACHADPGVVHQVCLIGRGQGHVVIAFHGAPAMPVPNVKKKALRPVRLAYCGALSILLLEVGG